MDYEKLTCSAAIAVNSLQNQIKELRAENEYLKTQLLNISSENRSKTSFYSGQVNSIQLNNKNKEDEMKTDIVFLCEKVRELEIENRIANEANEKLEKKLQENEKILGKLSATQRFPDQSSIESAQKDAEIDFLKKKVQWLEGSLSRESFSQIKPEKNNEWLNSSTRVFSTWRSNM